jgi:hypothetical protein
MLGAVRKMLAERPILTIVVYDESEHTFSRPHPGIVEKMVREQPWYWSTATRVKKLLRPDGDGVTLLRAVELFYSEVRDDVAREYVFVTGQGFSFGGPKRLARDFFDPTTDDLVLKYGDPAGVIVQNMIDHYLPNPLIRAR